MATKITLVRALKANVPIAVICNKYGVTREEVLKLHKELRYGRK